MTWPGSAVPRRDHCGVRGWLVLDEVLAASGDATAAAFRRESPRSGSSPVAKAAAGELRERGATVTRNSRAQWVADPADPVVIAWQRVLAGRLPPAIECNPALRPPRRSVDSRRRR